MVTVALLLHLTLIGWAQAAPPDYYGCAPKNFNPGNNSRNGGCMMQIASISPSQMKEVSNGCFNCLALEFCRKEETQCGIRASVLGVDKTAGFLTYVCDKDVMENSAINAKCWAYSDDQPYYLTEDYSGANVNLFTATSTSSCNFVVAVEGWGGASTRKVNGQNISVNEYTLSVQLANFSNSTVAPQVRRSRALELRAKHPRPLNEPHCGLIQDQDWCGTIQNGDTTYFQQPIRYVTPRAVSFDTSEKDKPDVWVAGLCESSLSQGKQVVVQLNLPLNPDWNPNVGTLKVNVYDITGTKKWLCGIIPDGSETASHTCTFGRTEDLEYVLIEVTGYKTAPVQYTMTMEFKK